MSLIGRWRFGRELKALNQVPDDAVRAYASADWPAQDWPVHDAPLLALDFELDGLRKDAHLLQAGWTPFTARTISLRDARSFDIRSYAKLDRTAVTVHGIGEERAARGLPIRNVADELLSALAGRILVAHAAVIETTALREASKALYGAALPIRSICTLSLERHLNPGLVGTEAYRLGPARARYGLPEYQPHDALTDALASAELFQAQLSRMAPATTLGKLEAL